MTCLIGDLFRPLTFLKKRPAHLPVVCVQVRSLFSRRSWPSFFGVKDLRTVFEQAKRRWAGGDQNMLLFVDELHRFNSAQQDGCLPFVEAGIVTLIDPTTENPSFEPNGALLSRCRVLVLERLEDAALEALAGRAEQAVCRALLIKPDARKTLPGMADGDSLHPPQI